MISQKKGELQTPVSQGLAPASACEESRTSVPGAIGDHRRIVVTMAFEKDVVAAGRS